MRGEHVVWRVGVDQVDRFIPTCVGSIWGPRSDVSGRTVHPHVRGEHSCGTSTSSNAAGSSPRAWGAFRVAACIEQCFRFIPTCVGSIRPSTRRWRGIAVHPHVRGEHTAHRNSGHAASGSSPRAWGAYFGKKIRGFPLRFIPTCVGSISLAAWAMALAAVHPHVRGEHGVGPRLPPPLWRFIPTCVGSMPGTPNAPSAVTVHPHVRGEHGGRRVVRRACGGSSPRAWGASPGRASRVPCIPVHPHVRGEHLLRIVAAADMDGSSPRAWGAFPTITK